MPTTGSKALPISAAVTAATTAAATADPRYRFLARFGATILSGGIAAIPMALYHYQAALELAPQEVWFVGYILAHRWTDALPYPSLRRMSRRTGVSTQMLHRYKQSLIEKGYLTTIPRHRPSGGRTSNFYDFTGLFQRLEQLLLHDRRDGSWQPTIDEEGHGDHGDHGDDAPEEGAGGVLVDAPRRAAKQAVPPSQREPAGAPLSWGDVANEVGQRALTGGSRTGLSGPKHPQATAAGHVRLSAPVAAAALQNQRLSDQTQQQSAPPSPDGGPSPGPERGDRFFSLHKGGPRRAVQAPSPSTDGQASAVPESAGQALAEHRWAAALERLADRIADAPLHSWIVPLRALPAATPTPVQERADLHGEVPLVLACASSFQRDLVDRRYRKLIEEVIGAPVELVVAPE